MFTYVVVSVISLPFCVAVVTFGVVVTADVIPILAAVVVVDDIHRITIRYVVYDVWVVAAVVGCCGGGAIVVGVVVDITVVVVAII